MKDLPKRLMRDVKTQLRETIEIVGFQSPSKFLPPGVGEIPSMHGYMRAGPVRFARPQYEAFCTPEAWNPLVSQWCYHAPAYLSARSL